MTDLFLPSESLQVQPGAELPTQVPALGAGIASKLSDLGEVQTRIYRDHNAVASMSAQNELRNWATEALYNPQTGALNKSAGANAPKVVDKTLSDYQAKRSEIAAKLPNDDARASFDLAADEHADLVKKQLYGYEHSQVTQSANQETAAYVENLRNSAVQRLGVMGPVSDAQTQDMRQGILDDIAKQKAAIADACARNGDSAAVCAEQQTRIASSTHMAVIGSLLDQGQDQTAKAWFDIHRDEMTAGDIDHAEAKVDIGSTAGEAQRWADTHVTDANGQPKSRQALMQQIQDDPRLQNDVKLRDQVQARVDSFLEHHNQAVSEAQKATFTEAAQIVQDPQNTLGIFDPKVQQMRLQMSPEHWSMLESMTKREAPKADPVAAYHFKMRLANPATRNEAAQEDLTTQFDPRTPEFKELGSLQAEALKGGGPQIESFLTREQAIDRAYALAGIKPADKNAPEGIAISDALEQRVRANETPGKKMTGDEINALAKQMLVENVVYRPGAIYGSMAVPAYQVAEGDRGTVTLPFAKLAERNPQQAAQAQTNLKTRAATIGLAPDRVTPAGYERALAHVIMARDLKASGDIDGSVREMEAADEAMRKSVPDLSTGLLPDESPASAAVRHTRERAGLGN